ncbi:HI1506-related protein [Stutzerimonas kirkiae]|uniref:HI1506-related protein n=1 Tax=Stutzerimonas kirkiae TaxID=2211392 RepID=UPI001038471B|nr:HI1506-related protein [Stutzerimonas kirkiae]TBV12759.1 hypothetical protein DNK01_13820 [Stutzerimonas kirkiae]
MGLIIRALHDGFRRAGIAHSAKGTYYPDGHFTEQQLKDLRGEPLLAVTEGVEEPEGFDNGRGKKATAKGGEPLAQGKAPTAAEATVAPAQAGVKPKPKGGKGNAKPAAVKDTPPPASVDQVKTEPSGTEADPAAAESSEPAQEE